MKSAAFLPAAALAGVATATTAHEWEAPGPDDFRGPCPMMNTLANHAYLPHDGRGLTRGVVVDALAQALHFNESLGSLMFDMALIANPEPNATYFTLDHLNRHNVLEHDASLSRADAEFGSNHVFNRTVFDESRAYWTEDTVTAEMLANSKMARQLASKAFNPEYVFTSTTEQFSLGELAAPIIAFGDMLEGEVDRELVEYFFLNERLPTELGWSIRDKVVGQEDVLAVSDMIAAAASLLTDTGNESSSADASQKHVSTDAERRRSLRRTESVLRDLHSGMRGGA